MKAIIIDDEASGRSTMRSYIGKYTSELVIVAEADDVKSGLYAILTHHPEVVFLDVNMPDGTGFDLLEKLPQINFKIIFVTAYQEYAIKAFKYSALDYLLKPLDPDDFIDAVSKLKTETKLDEIDQKIKTLLKNNIQLEKLALPTKSGLKMISFKRIVRCESDNNYTYFYLNDNTRELVCRTLKEYDTLLSDEGFYRVHKSHLVNVKYIKEYINRDGGSIVLEDGTKIEVSRRKKEGLVDLLTNLKPKG